MRNSCLVHFVCDYFLSSTLQLSGLIQGAEMACSDCGILWPEKLLVLLALQAKKICSLRLALMMMVECSLQVPAENCVGCDCLSHPSCVLSIMVARIPSTQWMNYI